VDSSDIDDRSTDEDSLLDDDEGYPKINLCQKLPIIQYTRTKVAVINPVNKVLDNEREKDIKRKTRACPYNPKGTNQGD
jgi:hypothetical protein